MKNKKIKHIYEDPKFGEPWFSYKGLYSSWVNELQNGCTVVEVGCWKGKSLAYLCTEILNSGKDIKVIAVDTWSGCDGEKELYKTFPEIVNNTLYDIFMENMKPFLGILTPLKMKSTEASKLFLDDSVDRIFIDACHTYECVKEDIQHWTPKVKINGVLAGHDIHSEEIKRGVFDSGLNVSNIAINTNEDYFLYYKGS